MGTRIIHPNPEVDEYVLWETTADMAWAVGTRKQVKKWYLQDLIRSAKRRAKQDVEYAMDLVDRRGTTDRITNSLDQTDGEVVLRGLPVLLGRGRALLRLLRIPGPSPGHLLDPPGPPRPGRRGAHRLRLPGHRPLRQRRQGVHLRQVRSGLRGPSDRDRGTHLMKVFKRRTIVRDGQGNHFAIDSVSVDTIDLHSVATKEAFTIPADYAFLTLTIVEGLVEA